MRCAIATLRPSRCLWAAAVLAVVVSFGASPARAQAQPQARGNRTAPAPTPARPSIDIAVTIISDGVGTDEIAIAYGKQMPAEEVKQDFAALATELGTTPPKVKVAFDRQIGFTSGEASMAGLVNWQSGQVNLDALVRPLRRFGHFRVLCFSNGAFPMPTPGTIVRPPVRIETAVSGGLVDYRVWIDQSQGVPKSLPSVAPSTGPDWKLVVGLVAIAVVLAAGVFLVVSMFLTQRRTASEVTEEKS